MAERETKKQANAAAAGEQDTRSRWDKLSVEAAVLDGVDGGSVPLDFLVGRSCIDSSYCPCCFVILMLF